MLSDELCYQLLRRLEANPDLRQRELAQELGISLGKLNYCLRSLIREGWVNAENSRNSRNRIVYRYTITPAGLREKEHVTLSFLKRKQSEYEALERELAELRQEVARNRGADGDKKG